MKIAPSALRLRAYQVGFGDCLLLSFSYPRPVDSGRDKRHILIDFGSTRLGRGFPSLAQTAAQIAEDCEGHLDAVVISHRHKDHLGAFGDRRAAPILRKLAPEVVIRSWTEHPDATDNEGKAELSLLEALADGEDGATRIVARAKRTGRHRRSNLVTFAADAIRNEAAVTALHELANGRGEYLWAGERTRLSELLPGVRVDVIGPPKPHQWSEVQRQAADHAQYWAIARKQASRYLSASPITAQAGPLRWIVNKLREDENEAMLSLVRWLDDAMNNTSLILLFSVGRHTLLFGGDAQIENWGWALNAKPSSSLGRRLDAVDLYKVGHHGSRNGTPRSLVDRWRARGTPLVSVLSTRPGVHGHGARKVPRHRLLTALAALGPVLRTDAIDDRPYLDVSADLPAGEYEYAANPS
ncbi:MAG: hypothetical protein M3406_10770 [Chloroflexota bacterium]|nr:hypothetical protein [Chloroflexota bacterium]